MWKFLRLNEGSVCMCVCVWYWSFGQSVWSEWRPHQRPDQRPLLATVLWTNVNLHVFSLFWQSKNEFYIQEMYPCRVSGRREVSVRISSYSSGRDERNSSLTSRPAQSPAAAGWWLACSLQSVMQFLCRLRWSVWWSGIGLLTGGPPLTSCLLVVGSAGTGEWAGQYWHYWSDGTASSTVTTTDHPPMIGRRLGEIRPATDHNQWYSVLSHNYLPSSHWELPSGYFATQCPPFFSLSFQHLDLIQTRGESVFMRTRNTFAKKVHLGIWIFMVEGSSLKDHL